MQTHRIHTVLPYPGKNVTHPAILPVWWSVCDTDALRWHSSVHRSAQPFPVIIPHRTTHLPEIRSWHICRNRKELFPIWLSRMIFHPDALPRTDQTVHDKTSPSVHDQTLKSLVLEHPWMWYRWSHWTISLRPVPHRFRWCWWYDRKTLRKELYAMQTFHSH